MASSAQNKEGGDGTRLKYVCQDSLQHRNRKSHKKKEKKRDSKDSEDQPNNGGNPSVVAYDCGGAIHIKFSIKREAINVVYKHNPIHSSPVVDERYVASKTYGTCKRLYVPQVIGMPLLMY